MRLVSRPLAVCCLLLLAVGLAANTRFGFGTIVKVDFTGEDSRKNRPSFVVRFEFRNLKGTAVLPTMAFPIRQRTRHGWRVYLLDGESSTAEEALAVGRAICVSDNDMVCHVASVPGPAPLDVAATPNNAVWHLRLKHAFSAELAKLRKGEVGEYERRSSPVEVLVACREGRVRAAVAVLPRLRGATDHVLPLDDFTLADGTLKGEFSITVPFPEGDARYRPRNGAPIPLTCAFEVSADENGRVQDSYIGTCGQDDTDNSLDGELLPAVAPAGSSRIWLQFDALTGHKFIYAIADLSDGTVQSGGRVLGSKGNPIGAIEAQDLTLSDGRLRGTLSCTAKEKTYALELDAALYGGRLLFGTYTMPGENGPVTRALRGGLAPADGPQIEGCDQEQKAAVKKMQDRLHPPEEKKDP